MTERRPQSAGSEVSWLLDIKQPFSHRLLPLNIFCDPESDMPAYFHHESNQYQSEDNEQDEIERGQVLEEDYHNFERVLDSSLSGSALENYADSIVSRVEIPTQAFSKGGQTLYHSKTSKLSNVDHMKRQSSLKKTEMARAQSESPYLEHLTEVVVKKRPQSHTEKKSSAMLSRPPTSSSPTTVSPSVTLSPSRWPPSWASATLSDCLGHDERLLAKQLALDVISNRDAFAVNSGPASCRKSFDEYSNEQKLVRDKTRVVREILKSRGVLKPKGSVASKESKLIQQKKNRPSQQMYNSHQQSDIKSSQVSSNRPKTTGSQVGEWFHTLEMIESSVQTSHPAIVCDSEESEVSSLRPLYRIMKEELDLGAWQQQFNQPGITNKASGPLVPAAGRPVSPLISFTATLGGSNRELLSRELPTVLTSAKHARKVDSERRSLIPNRPLSLNDVQELLRFESCPPEFWITARVVYFILMVYLENAILGVSGTGVDIGSVTDNSTASHQNQVKHSYENFATTSSHATLKYSTHSNGTLKNAQVQSGSPPKGNSAGSPRSVWQCLLLALKANPSLSSRDCLSLQFSYPLLRQLLLLKSLFLEALARVEGDQNFSVIYPESLLVPLSRLVRSSMFRPAALIHLSPAAARLCVWARRVVAKIYLVHTRRLAEESASGGHGNMSSGSNNDNATRASIESKSKYLSGSGLLTRFGGSIPRSRVEQLFQYASSHRVHRSSLCNFSVLVDFENVYSTNGDPLSNNQIGSSSSFSGHPWVAMRLARDYEALSVVIPRAKKALAVSEDIPLSTFSENSIFHAFESPMHQVVVFPPESTSRASTFVLGHSKGVRSHVMATFAASQQSTFCPLEELSRRQWVDPVAVTALAPDLGYDAARKLELSDWSAQDLYRHIRRELRSNVFCIEFPRPVVVVTSQSERHWRWTCAAESSVLLQQNRDVQSAGPNSHAEWQAATLGQVATVSIDSASDSGNQQFKGASEPIAPNGNASVASANSSAFEVNLYCGLVLVPGSTHKSADVNESFSYYMRNPGLSRAAAPARFLVCVTDSLPSKAAVEMSLQLAKSCDVIELFHVLIPSTRELTSVTISSPPASPSQTFSQPATLSPEETFSLVNKVQSFLEQRREQMRRVYHKSSMNVVFSEPLDPVTLASCYQRHFERNAFKVDDGLSDGNFDGLEVDTLLRAKINRVITYLLESEQPVDFVVVGCSYRELETLSLEMISTLVDKRLSEYENLHFHGGNQGYSRMTANNCMESKKKSASFCGLLIQQMSMSQIKNVSLILVAEDAYKC